MPLLILFAGLLVSTWLAWTLLIALPLSFLDFLATIGRWFLGLMVLIVLSWFFGDR